MKRKRQEKMLDINVWLEEGLEEIFEGLDGEDEVVKAAKYSLFAGGKRVRPALMYTAAEAIGVNVDEIRPYACALEMIHTYSLIHDDLPAMDNDDLRRGRPTCHKAFGEAIAILAGDMLLNKAHEVLLEESLKDQNHAKAGLNISTLAGIAGMIGGQSIDISSEGKKISLDLLYKLQEKKTGALIEAAVTTPVILKGVGDGVLTIFKDYANHLGLAFQIQDDILDVESDEATLGKTTGKDERDNKPTFVTLLGLDGAKDKLMNEEDLCRKALKDLSDNGLNVSELEELIDKIFARSF